MSDLVVVGAGTMGAWTALRARRAGRSVALLDAYGPGNSRSSSGDETRIIRSSHGADAFYARWSRAAREAWIKLGEQVGERIFVQAGALWFARRDGAFEDASIATLTAEGIPVERLSPAEIAARWPGIAVDDLAFGAFEPEAGLLMARRGVFAAARRVEAEGGSVAIAAVRPGRVDGDRLLEVVDSGGRRWAADAFVFACGPWLPKLFPDVVGDAIRVTKQDLHYLGPAPGDDRWNAPRFPSWVDYETTWYGIGAVEGRGVKVATDSYGGTWDPDTGARIVSPQSIDAVRDYCRRRFPDLADAPVLETRVCQYETTADSHFLIDRHPGWSNVWLVGGGSGHGFKHGPSIGAYVVSLLDGHEPSGEERRFALGRDAAAPSGLRTMADAAR
ncbi:MAG TPA: FAD-dependent oxidoreductase [Candidatus Limnocylindrales bacterium]